MNSNSTAGQENFVFHPNAHSLPEESKENKKDQVLVEKLPEKEDEKQKNLQIEKMKKVQEIVKFVPDEPYQFFYVKFIFHGRPQGLKTSLVRLVSYFNIFGRAAKKYYNGQISTILECFGTEKNLDFLNTALNQVANGLKLKMNEYIRKSIPSDIKILQNLPDDIIEFLLTDKAIEDTPYYMKRQSSASEHELSQCGDEKTLNYLTTQKAHTIINFLSDLWKQINPVERLQCFGLKYVNQMTTEHLQFNLIPNLTEENPTKKETPAPTIPDDLETPEEVVCRMLGRKDTVWFLMNLYPSEPPTTVFPKIKEKFPGESWENILLFDENGNLLNSDMQLSQLKSRNFSFYFLSNLEIYEKKQPQIGSIMRDCGAFHTLCILSIRDIGLESLNSLVNQTNAEEVANWLKIGKMEFLLLMDELKKIEIKEQKP